MTAAQVTLAWIGSIVAASALFIGYFATRRPKSGYVELGAMNEQWLAEQRSNDRPY